VLLVLLCLLLAQGQRGCMLEPVLAVLHVDLKALL
jgi:hypothetical protein